MYEPIQSARLYEQIAAQIEERIFNGDLEHGDKLPSELELADQFGVSRTAVREAIKALRAKGLVEVQPGRGTFVTDGASQVLRTSLGQVLKVSDEGRLENLIEIREILEPRIAALAAERAEENDIQAMQSAIEAMDLTIDDAEAFIEADLAFHLALAHATNNVLIPLLIDPIVDMLQEQRIRIFKTQKGSERGQYHHKQILASIVARDPKAAHDAMEAHLAQVRKDSGD
jgi:GntR family transcriptional repressor for pyruvate dehydrogenase complex